MLLLYTVTKSITAHTVYLLSEVLRLFFFIPVVSRGTSFCLERAVEAVKTEEEGNEEICAIRLESSALPLNMGLNQIIQDEETRPGQSTTPRSLFISNLASDFLIFSLISVLYFS